MPAEPSKLERIDERIDRLTDNIEKLTEDIRQLRDESKDLSSRFGYYQQSSQTIVNLAFSLVASATVSVFITAILKR
jgi:cell division septum initiation protein DivIVA